MNIKFDLNITQTQKLIMTQEMRQSIEILQLTAMELNGLIETEIMENPVLEFNEVSIKEVVPINEDGGPLKGDLVKEEPNPEPQPKEEIQWDEYFSSMENSDYRGQLQPIADNDDEYGFEKFTSQEKTLNEYLHFQFTLQEKSFSEEEKRIAEYLIDCIDDNGYLLIDMDYVKNTLEVDEDRVQKMITIIQGFDPSGVGCRDIKECLLIQLRQMGYDDDEVFMDIVKNHLIDLADNQFKRIAQETGLTIEDVYEFKEVIKTLEPKPGREFSCSERVSYVIPDGSIEIVNDELVVKVNDVSAPRLRINNYYKGLLKNSDKNDETKLYLEKKLDSAAFLIKSIEQRRDTIKKVITAIAESQRGFFFEGVGDLRPLTLKTIAETIEVHESTVSRAIRGKYIQTPKGTFALKFFFKRGYSQGEEDRSSDAIKRLIQELIDQEDKKKPLSDQRISELLQDKNLDVARRTVAKYREALLIQPSSKRKEYR
ncbi:RNA polymerase factor sigma-54 [Acetobacterium wieringae]|uniref:RNA polymerase factor sigma-54 n=1 Tax=Acetobacterium wieringae TaxID=52694 RepID=UPI0026F083A9|nr:RNA polymerase factor sigma-54 [Acetobacterium wieringae]